MNRIDFKGAMGSATWRVIKRKRKDGSVRSFRMVTIYYDVDGVRMRKSKSFPSDASLETEVKRRNALRKWISELEAEQEEAAEQERLQLEEAERENAERERRERETPLVDYIERYIKSREATHAIESSTASDYRKTARRLVARFGDVTIQGLRAADVQDFYTDELKRGIGSGTVAKVHRLLKQVFTYAHNHEEVEKNIMVLVEPPKRSKKKPNGLDIAEAKRVTKLLMDAPASDVTVAAFLALHASLRCGEVCGLQWRDVDLDAGVVHVHQSVGLGDGGAYLKSTKTDSSTRDVDIDDDLVEKLRERREVMREKLSRDGVFMLKEKEFDNLFVCGSVEGGFPNPYVIGRKWAAISESANIVGTEGKPATFHTLRHGFATIGIALGVDVASIAGQMGHSTVSLTLNTYTSSTAAGKRHAAKLIGDALHPADTEADIIPLKTGTDEK